MRPITTVEQLRALYATPSERALKKQLSRLDVHCRRFIELSPFVVVATGDGESFDASPRGGAPGFVRVVDDGTLWIPDASGNNRLDSLANILRTGRIGLLFLIPGIDETLRVNGGARIDAGAEVLAAFSSEPRPPKSVIAVAVEEAFLQCAKALMRAQLWSDAARADRSVLPPMGRMLADQTGSDAPIESQEEMLARYRRDL